MGVQMTFPVNGILGIGRKAPDMMAMAIFMERITRRWGFRVGALQMRLDRDEFSYRLYWGPDLKDHSKPYVILFDGMEDHQVKFVTDYILDHVLEKMRENMQLVVRT